LSDDEACREGGLGRGVEVDSLFGVAVALRGTGVFVPLSEAALAPSRVENIRVSRLVIDGFSGTTLSSAASVCGAATPLAVKLSTLGIELLFRALAGFESVDPVTEDDADSAGDLSGLL